MLKINSLVSIKENNSVDKIYDKKLSVVESINNDTVRLYISGDLFKVDDLIDVTEVATEKLVEFVLKENEKFRFQNERKIWWNCLILFLLL